MSRATTIIVDIETCPDQREGAPERALQNLKVPGTHKKPETIAKWLDENADKAYRDTALDGGYGEIIIIGYALDDGEVETLSRRAGAPDEALMLKTFWSYVASATVAAPTWVGHNVLWDLKFLYHRSMVLGLDVPTQLPLAPAPWSPQVADTSYMWTWDRTRSISLSELAGILGVECKTGGIDGSQVWDLAQQGEYDSLAAYCKEDVQAVREIYRRLRPAW